MAGLVTEEWVLSLTESIWLLPALFMLTVGDALLVVLPSEVAVAALAALWGSTGTPWLPGVIVVAAGAAVVGDSLCYLIGRTVGTDRWAWQRRPRVASAIARAEHVLRARPAFLIFTARYIPYARIAVNLTAGSIRYPLARFVPLSVAAGLTWAVYHSLIGAFFGYWFRDNPLLALALMIVGAMTLGIVVDRTIALVTRRRAARAASAP